MTAKVETSDGAGPARPLPASRIMLGRAPVCRDRGRAGVTGVHGARRAGAVVSAATGERVTVVAVRPPAGPAGGVLPSRTASVADRDHFVALARLSRSATELLAAVLHRPVRVQPVTNRVVEIDRGSTDAGPHLVRVVQHRLLDSRPPHRPLALSSTALLGARLPDTVRSAARRGHDPLSELLDRTGAFWTPETLEVEQVPAGDTGWAGHAPVIRLARRLFLLGTPVAHVVEEISVPEPAASRSPPDGPVWREDSRSVHC